MTAIPCIVIPGSDRFTLWDCICDECFQLQREADDDYDYGSLAVDDWILDRLSEGDI